MIFMKVKIFTLKYESAIGRIDDAILTDFVKDKEVISVKDHFFIKDKCPHLAMIVTYMQNPVSEEVRGEKKTRPEETEINGEKSWRKVTCPCLTP